MTRTNRLRTAFAAALLSLPSALLFAAAPAHAAQPAPAAPAAHGSSATGSATPPPGSKLIATFTSTKNAAPGVTGPTIHCEVFASGLYILQPGGTLGPITNPYADSTAMADSSWVTCSYPVARIAVQADLFVNGVGYDSGYTSYSDNSQVSPTNYDWVYRCWQGLWQTSGSTVITFPPGYTPQSMYLQTKSSGVFIPAYECTPLI